MRPDLQSRVDRIEDGRRLLLQQLGQMPPQARGWRPDASTWSPLQVAHHLALIDAQTVKGLEASLSASDLKPGLKSRLGRMALWGVFRFRLRVSIPTERVRPDPELSLNQVESLWTETRDALLSHLRSVDQTRLDEPVLKHPLAGPMTYLEWLDFLIQHHDHHVRQLHRLRSHPDFPWNA